MKKSYYMSAKDLQKIIPNLTYNRALKIIEEARKIMKEKNYLIPITKEKLALTKIVNEMLGI